MANFIRPLPIEFMGYTSWPLRSSKEIPPFIDDVTEHTCSHSSLGCLGIRTLPYHKTQCLEIRA